ncbi:hypothetical protein [Paenibacillus mucilaginosus]|uniref:hypothetical protein n=1 Tax=Paenibacillus mucilaginosus TaxID=61624 RepID=UPI003D21B549
MKTQEDDRFLIRKSDEISLKQGETVEGSTVTEFIMNKDIDVLVLDSFGEIYQMNFLIHGEGAENYKRLI